MPEDFEILMEIAKLSKKMGDNEKLIHGLIFIFCLPLGAQLLNVLRGFEIYRGMPQCAGAIDGTHIHVMPPEEVQADYLNRKGFHSINLQAVCDHRLRYVFKKAERTII